MIVLLDSGPLGLITNPKATIPALECKAWADMQQDHGHTIAVSQIIEYEVRHELLRVDKARGVQHLDAYIKTVLYQPLSPENHQLCCRIVGTASQ